MNLINRRFRSRLILNSTLSNFDISFFLLSSLYVINNFLNFLNFLYNCRLLTSALLSFDLKSFKFLLTCLRLRIFKSSSLLNLSIVLLFRINNVLFHFAILNNTILLNFILFNIIFPHRLRIFVQLYSFAFGHGTVHLIGLLNLLLSLFGKVLIANFLETFNEILFIETIARLSVIHNVKNLVDV